jgi:GDP-L-fucose synthase
MKEDALLTGALEETNSAYAVAKIAGLKLIQAYRQQFDFKWNSAMPTNLYGPNDNFDFKSSHVIPGLIAKFHNAKENNAKSITLWGTGSALREFLHVDDLAQAVDFIYHNYDDDDFINIGSGQELSIKDLALMIQELVGFKGEIIWDANYPDGTPRKLLDSSKISALGWKPKISLSEGIAATYQWYLANH